MRADFGSSENQKSFFKSVKSPYLTWKDFYVKILNVSQKTFSFRAFQHWYKGERLPPLEIVQAILTFSNFPPSKLGIKIRDEMWGRSKGGKMKISIHGCNLNEIDRILGGKASYKALVSRLGDNFKEYWGKISSKDGTSTVISQKNLMRKIIGPKGERMFNKLENDVACVLFSKGIDYRYEPVFILGHQSIILDFKIGNLIIECTGWANAKPKAMALRAKIERLSTRYPNLDFLVVTSSSLKKRYMQQLNRFVKVLSIQEFQQFVTGLTGNPFYS